MFHQTCCQIFEALREGNKREGADDGKEAGGNDDSGSSLICATEGGREKEIYIATRRNRDCGELSHATSH